MKKLLLLAFSLSIISNTESTIWQNTKDFLSSRPMMLAYGVALGGGTARVFLYKQLEEINKKIDQITLHKNDKVSLDDATIELIRSKIKKEFQQVIQDDKRMESVWDTIKNDLRREMQEQIKREDISLEYPLPNYKNYIKGPHYQADPKFGQIINEAIEHRKKNNVISYIEFLTKNSCIVIEKNPKTYYFDNTKTKYLFRIKQNVSHSQTTEASNLLWEAKLHLESLNKYRRSQMLQELEFYCNLVSQNPDSTHTFITEIMIAIPQ